MCPPWGFGGGSGRGSVPAGGICLTAGWAWWLVGGARVWACVCACVWGLALDRKWGGCSSVLGPCNQGLPLLWTWVAFCPAFTLRPPGCRQCLGAPWRQRVGPLWRPWPRCQGEGTLTGSPSWTHNRWCYLFFSVFGCRPPGGFGGQIPGGPLPQPGSSSKSWDAGFPLLAMVLWSTASFPLSRI